MERCDVAVLGAGLAGLCAARDLALAGLDVIVLEARERVGGRTYTVPFEAAGCHVDLGAEWVAPAHHLALMTELSRYGIALEPAADAAEKNEPDALREPFLTLINSLEVAASELSPRQSNWYQQGVGFDVPVSHYLSQFNLEESARNYLLANGFALQGADPDEYSLINLLHEFASFGSVIEAFHAAECRVEGGAQSLATAIGQELGERLRLGWVVESLSTDDTGVLVTGLKGMVAAQVRAEQVIVALPLNVLRDVGLNFSMPTSAHSVIQQGHVGRAAKGWATAQMSNHVTSTGWPNAVEVYSRSGQQSAAICTFAVASPDHDQALNQSWQAVCERHPEVALQGDYRSHDWIRDPYARGTWLSCAPGQVAGLHALADMPPPIVFAGGDLSRGWYGWMEGAVTSGRDAAHRILAHRRDGSMMPAAG